MVSSTKVDRPGTGSRRRTPPMAAVLAMYVVDHGFGSPVVRDSGSVHPGDWADAPQAGLGFPRHGLACGASNRTDGTDATRKARRGVRQPNDLLRRARLGLISPSGSGRRMSRQELAEAVNALLFAASGRRSNLDDKYVGKLERGEIRWPSAVYRQAFRAVLGASTDAELGFYIVRRTGDDGTGAHDHVVESHRRPTRLLAGLAGLPVSIGDVTVVYVIVAGHVRAFAATSRGTVDEARPEGVA